MFPPGKTAIAHVFFLSVSYSGNFTLEEPTLCRGGVRATSSRRPTTRTARRSPTRLCPRHRCPMSALLAAARGLRKKIQPAWEDPLNLYELSAQSGIWNFRGFLLRPGRCAFGPCSRRVRPFPAHHFSVPSGALSRFGSPVVVSRLRGMVDRLLPCLLEESPKNEKYPVAQPPGIFPIDLSWGVKLFQGGSLCFRAPSFAIATYAKCTQRTK